MKELVGRGLAWGWVEARWLKREKKNLKRKTTKKPICFDKKFEKEELKFKVYLSRNPIMSKNVVCFIQIIKLRELALVAS